MPSQLLRTWLATYDPIHRGWTRAGIGNGLCTTCGFGFPRIRGGYNLYRALAGVTDPAWELVGAAGADGVEVGMFSWVRHSVGAEYVYRLVPVGGGGVENWTDVTRTNVRFSDYGWWIGPLPNAPCDLQVLPARSGRFVVRWSYYPNDQAAEPAGFNLYSSVDGEIDYGSINGTVLYQPGCIHFEYLTFARPDGQRVGWAVRAYAASGQEERNTHAVFARARAAGPPALPVVKISVV